jgi:hypothetical protein
MARARADEARGRRAAAPAPGPASRATGAEAAHLAVAGGGEPALPGSRTPCCRGRGRLQGSHAIAARVEAGAGPPQQPRPRPVPGGRGRPRPRRLWSRSHRAARGATPTAPWLPRLGWPPPPPGRDGQLGFSNLTANLKALRRWAVMAFFSIWLMSVSHFY